MTRIIREVIDLDEYIARGGDHGCHHHPRCATCPFTECQIDNPIPIEITEDTRWNSRRERDREITEMRQQNPEVTIAEIADRFDLSHRTVYRVLKHAEQQRQERETQMLNQQCTLI